MFFFLCNGGRGGCCLIYTKYKKMDRERKKSFIYTGTGDGGTTSLQGMGSGVPKTDPVFSLLDQFELLQLAVGRVLEVIRRRGGRFDDIPTDKEMDLLFVDITDALVNCQYVLWELSGAISRSCKRAAHSNEGGGASIWTYIVSAFFFPTKSILQYDSDDDDYESEGEYEHPETHDNLDCGGDPLTSSPPSPPDPKSVEKLEQLIDMMEVYLPPLRNFLRMDKMSRDTLDVHDARLRAREVERAFLAFLENEDYEYLSYGRPGCDRKDDVAAVPDWLLESYYRKYFNRLSDFFFQLARYCNLILWRSSDAEYTNDVREEAIFRAQPSALPYVMQ